MKKNCNPIYPSISHAPETKVSPATFTLNHPTLFSSRGFLFNPHSCSGEQQLRGPRTELEGATQLDPVCTDHGSTSTPAIRSNRLLCFSSIVVTVNNNHEGRALISEAQPI